MYLGIDIGSVSIKYALIDKDFLVLESDYFRTHGDILNSLKRVLSSIQVESIDGIVTTGSARKFVGTLISADADIDEITAHRTAIATLYPGVQTIFEIGGQDSKLIYFSDNSVDFEMNHVCAAGTGSFLDQQAARLGLSIEVFCQRGLKAQKSHKIASKCTVFAESDMIHAQQSGVPIDEIIRGVHKGMVSNYFSQLCKGKKLKGDFLFEGGTSENPVLVEEFTNRLLQEGMIDNRNQLMVPYPHNKVIGAIGAAILGMKRGICKPRPIPEIRDFEFLESESCNACPNKCGAKITKIKVNQKTLTLGRSCQ